MFNPQLILAALLAIATSLGIGFYNGQHWANTKHEAARAQAQDTYQAQLNKQLAHANDLSGKLAQAEGRITTKTIEVIKYVPKYTTGAPCLNAGTVGLLQPGSNQGFRAPTSEPTAEDARPASSDTDIAYWIAQANQQYETCSARLSKLVDFEMVTNPEPLQSDGL